MSGEVNDAASGDLDVYLVGGAVRDELLGLPVTERDWVVVGSTPDELASRGFSRVGKGFPVFLHPETKEEYALARLERKTAAGYTGFDTEFSTNVTLEEDLARRDLTVNAIAKRPDGTLVDPNGGTEDLQNKLLRHVTDAFVEDPLRVLRVARFLARYAHLGFRIAPETQELMQQIAASGELQTLPKERIWVETERAMGERRPDQFVHALHQCSALGVLYPEVEALFGVAQNPTHHPEGDAGTHLLMVLQQAGALAKDSLIGFAALTHDLGKALTPREQLPSHRGHELGGIPAVQALCRRLAVPKRFQRLAEVTCRHHLNAHRASEIGGDALMTLLEDTGALRKPDDFDRFLLVCEADSRGRLGHENDDYPQADFLRRAAAVISKVTAATVLSDRDAERRRNTDRGTGGTKQVPQKLEGEALGAALRAARVRALDQMS